MNCYSVLGLSQSATLDEIKTAYKKVARIHHPDLVGNTQQNTQQMAKINDAYKKCITDLAEHTNFVNHQDPLPVVVEIKIEIKVGWTNQQWKDRYWVLASQALQMPTRQRKAWISFQLEQECPPLFIWQLHGELSNYKAGWAYYQHKRQEENK
jgi:DnaJ domain